MQSISYACFSWFLPILMTGQTLGGMETNLQHDVANSHDSFQIWYNMQIFPETKVISWRSHSISLSRMTTTVIGYLFAVRTTASFISLCVIYYILLFLFICFIYVGEDVSDCLFCCFSTEDFRFALPVNWNYWFSLHYWRSTHKNLLFKGIIAFCKTKVEQLQDWINYWAESILLFPQFFWVF